MKTFLLKIPQRLKLKSQELDVQAALCDKAWTVFNDDGVKQLFIFQTDGTLIISTNGVVVNSSWRFIPANKSIIITSDDKSGMYHPAFLDGVVFALQQDGNNACLFMIDENNQQSFLPKTLTELGAYFALKEKALIEEEKRIRIEEKPASEPEPELEPEPKHQIPPVTPKPSAPPSKPNTDDEDVDITEMILLSLLIGIPASSIPGFFWAWNHGGTVLEGMAVFYLPTVVVVAFFYYLINKKK